MNTLLEAHPEWQDDALEEAAALLCVAVGSAEIGFAQDDLPSSLRQKLERDADEFLAETPRSSSAPSPFRPNPSAIAFIGGVLAAAAVFALYLGVLTIFSRTASPSLDQSYAQFEKTTPNVATYPWTITEAGYEQVAGEVAWSGTTQNGYMVLENLPANDPAQAQYQLWIVDPTRDEFPVDGGVFDVADHLAADGKAYVPINAKLRVDQPAAFAITLEQPGGVVKSNNALLVVAAVN